MNQSQDAACRWKCVDGGVDISTHLSTPADHRHPTAGIDTSCVDERCVDRPLDTRCGYSKVDLKQGAKVDKNCYPGLRTWRRAGDMFLANSKLWVLGCYPKADKVDECVSFLDLDSDSDSESDKEWEHLPLPGKFLTLATLDGSKIYGHNHLDLNRYAEDQNLGLDWFEFIENPVAYGEKYRWIRGSIVPDPPNNRILFNMPPCNIYAYYPNPTNGEGEGEGEGEVRFVGHGAVYWSHVVAVAGNIAYVHHHDPESLNYKLLHAYDLSNSDLNYLECVWTSTVVDGVDIIDFAGHFDGLFHVPNTDNFWLAAWIPVSGSGTRSLHFHFVKFQASRDNDVDGRILCTPLAHVSSLLENTFTVRDFLLIHGSSLNS